MWWTATSTVPTRPGLRIDLNIEEILKHPYQQENYIPLFKQGWESARSKLPESRTQLRAGIHRDPRAQDH